MSRRTRGRRELEPNPRLVWWVLTSLLAILAAEGLVALAWFYGIL